MIVQGCEFILRVFDARCIEEQCINWTCDQSDFQPYLRGIQKISL